MKKVSLLFPGQGSQYVGMGLDLFEKFDVAKEIYLKAESILGYDIKEISFNGPSEKLKNTEICQPAIFLHSIILFELLKERGISFNYAAGHSLGEYTAITAANAVDFESGLKIVKRRGELIKEASEQNPGGMAAIIGLERKKVEEICSELGRNGLLQLVNFNSPNQIVISGSNELITQAIEKAKLDGALKAVKLEVSGAFHSNFMEPAYYGIIEYLKNISFKKPQFPIVSNVTAKPMTEQDEIKKNVTKQIISAVMWEDSMRFMLDEGVDVFIELGPGGVLKGLLKRIDKNAFCLGIDKADDLDELSKIFN